MRPVETVYFDAFESLAGEKCAVPRQVEPHGWDGAEIGFTSLKIHHG